MNCTLFPFAEASLLFHELQVEFHLPVLSLVWAAAASPVALFSFALFMKPLFKVLCWVLEAFLFLLGPLGAISNIGGQSFHPVL